MASHIADVGLAAPDLALAVCRAQNDRMSKSLERVRRALAAQYDMELGKHHSDVWVVELEGSTKD